MNMPDKENLRALGIDYEEGLAYCASDPEFYREMLGEYIEEIGEVLSQLRQDCARQDWADYRIRVHALKSTSRMIGAETLSAIAARMEKAANEADTAAIEAEHAEMMEKYRAVTAALAPYCAGEGEDPAPAEDDEDILEFLPD